MPYIKIEDRKKFKQIFDFVKHHFENKNAIFPELLIYKVLEIYLKQNKECYDIHNDIMGVLICSKKEYTRRWDGHDNNTFFSSFPIGDTDEFNDILSYIRTFNIIQTKGELNYFITKTMLILKENGYYKDDEIQNLYNLLMDKWYEKVTIYKDKKILENGDI